MELIDHFASVDPPGDFIVPDRSNLMTAWDLTKLANPLCISCCSNLDQSDELAGSFTVEHGWPFASGNLSFLGPGENERPTLVDRLRSVNLRDGDYLIGGAFRFYVVTKGMHMTGVTS